MLFENRDCLVQGTAIPDNFVAASDAKVNYGRSLPPVTASVFSQPAPVENGWNSVTNGPNKLPNLKGTPSLADVSAG